MPIALTPEQTWEYQLVEDRIPDANGKRTSDCLANPSGTFFELRALRPHVEAAIEDRFINYRGGANGGIEVTKADLGSRTVEILQEALVGWRNFRDSDGRSVPFVTKKIGGRDVCDVEKCLGYLSAAQRHELAGAATSHSRPTVAESD